MPSASSLTAQGIAAAARAMRLPLGALPNGSGLEFGKVGSPDAGANINAASVIWEWMPNGKRVVVWPPQYATQAVQPIAIAA